MVVCPCFRGSQLTRTTSFGRMKQREYCMDGLSDWVQVIVAIVALLGLVWRFETRISGLDHA